MVKSVPFAVFLLLLSLGLTAQPFTATLSAGLLNVPGAKAVVVSYDDGTVAFLKNFSTAPFEDSFVVNLRKDAGRKLNLTIFHESVDENSPDKTPVLKAVTFFHLPTGVVIPSIPGKKQIKTRSVKLHFKNIKSVQDLVVDAPLTGRDRGTHVALGGLVFTYEAAVDDDVFVLLKANREAGHRYFYLPAGANIPGEIDFNKLPFDLKIVAAMPPTGHTVYNIRATNEDTGNDCLLFNFNPGNQKPGNVPEVFLPEKYGFYGFKSWIRSENAIAGRETKLCSDDFYYTVNADTLPVTWPLPDARFDFSFFQSDRRSFTLQLQQPSDAWRVQFRMPLGAGLSFSTWDVVGSGESTVGWKLPVLPEELAKSFPATEPDNMVLVHVQRHEGNFWEQPGQFFEASYLQPDGTLRRKKVFGCGWKK